MITPEIQTLLEQLGALIKSDARITRMNAAREAYAEDKALSASIMEYNAQQEALSNEYKKDSPDKQLTDAIEARINALYHAITESHVYEEFSRAEDEANDFLTEVNGELTFRITGSRPCSHDCSSCGSACHEHNH